MASSRSLGPALSYAEEVQVFLMRVWALIAAAMAKLRIPDAGNEANRLRALASDKVAARTGKSRLSRALRQALKAAEVKASLVLAEVKSSLLDRGKVEEARSLPKRSAKGLEDRKAWLLRIFNVASQCAGVAANDVKDLGARLQAVYAAEDAVPAQGRDSRPMTEELRRQVDDLVRRSASFVEICRRVAFLTGDPSLAAGAPVEPGPRSRRRQKAEKAQDATAEKAADAKDAKADAKVEPTKGETGK